MASATVGLIWGLVQAALNALNPTSLAPLNGTVFAAPSGAGYDIFWDLAISGTALSTLSVVLQGSMDAAFTNPVQIDSYALVANMGQFVTGKETPFLRLRIVTATGGDGTSLVVGRIFLKKRGADV
jgi:hypothetical protein